MCPRLIDNNFETVSTVSTLGPQNEMLEAGGASPDESCARPLIEIGWIIAGKLDEPDRQATLKAREESREWLRDAFQELEWKMPLIEREEVTGNSQQVESVELLDYSVTERNLRHWDFTLIITSADLVSHYKKDAMSVVSRSLQAAVISTARIDPRAHHPNVSRETRINVMARRIRSLVIHLVGHLAGLEHEEDDESYMASFETVGDLDRANRLGDKFEKRFLAGLHQVADRRLEEQTHVRRLSKSRFYLQAAWINRRQIMKAVLQAKPWQFPFRLNRLTTAAASAMLVVIITAEAWELALSQPALQLVGLAVAAIVLTTLFVLKRQRLLVRREHARLSELSVVTNLSTLAIVFLGMATTFTLLAIVTFALGRLLFHPELVANWTPTVEEAHWIVSHGKLAALVASVGMFIGALGASFEQQQYFRHITFVDEEI